jgi:hypothetical protein
MPHRSRGPGRPEYIWELGRYGLHLDVAHDNANADKIIGSHWHENDFCQGIFSPLLWLATGL